MREILPIIGILLATTVGVIILYLAFRFLVGLIRGAEKVATNVAEVVGKVGDEVEKAVSFERTVSDASETRQENKPVTAPASEIAEPATQLLASPNPTPHNVDLLHKLADLKEKGLITDEEFQTEKRKILG